MRKIWLGIQALCYAPAWAVEVKVGAELPRFSNGESGHPAARFAWKVLLRHEAAGPDGNVMAKTLLD